MQYGDTICLHNRTNLVGTIGFEASNLLQLDYFNKRNFRYGKLVLVILDTIAQRFGKPSFLVRYKLYKGMGIKKVSHNSKPNGSGTSSLYLVSFTSFLGTGLKNLLSILLDFLAFVDVVFISKKTFQIAILLLIFDTTIFSSSFFQKNATGFYALQMLIFKRVGV